MTDRLLNFISYLAARQAQTPPTVERCLLGLAAVVFAGATIWAARSLPSLDRHSIRGVWLCGALMLGVLGVMLNALEFGLSAHLLQRRLSKWETLRVSLLGSAANVLPLPGAIIIRVRALRQSGERAATAVTVTAAMGIAWISAASLLAGALLLNLSDSRILGIAFLGIWLVLAAVFGALVKSAGGVWSGGSFTAVTGVETSKVAVSAARLYAAGKAVSLDLTLTEAVTINLGAVLSHAVTVVPGGFGVREIVSGAFAQLAGAAMSLGVLISVVDRVVIYSALGALVVLVILVDKHLPHRVPLKQNDVEEVMRTRPEETGV